MMSLHFKGLTFSQRDSHNGSIAYSGRRHNQNPSNALYGDRPTAFPAGIREAALCQLYSNFNTLKRRFALLSGMLGRSF